MSNTRQQRIETLNQAIQRLGNFTVLFTQAIASRIGLSATEFEALSLLDDHGPMPAGRLAELSGLTTGAITGIVDRLERAGFAKRTADPSDRRRVIVEPVIHDGALQKVIEAYAPVSRAFNELVTKYSDEQIEVITGFIDESLKNMEVVRRDMLEADNKGQ